ncbi:hypothetical protein SNEBB_010166 [Seison nebaliae]|nr:hypothetical protein SNEBB_010166 [Seison nebaliae]
MEMFLKYLKKDEKFIENDFKINLKDIYKPNYIFLRTEEATKAFKDLKEYLETDPTLFYLVPSLETYLIIDLDLEANHIMDVSVMQWNLKNNIRWPIGYYQFDSDAEYKKLDEQHDNDTQYYNGRQRKRNTYPESNVAYCFMKAIKRFEHYLLETEFRILCKKKNKYVEYFTTSTTDNYHNEFFEKFEFSFWFN